MAIPIGTLDYTYGAGQAANRQVQFFRPGAANTIQARVFVLNADGGIGAQTSTVTGNNVVVEIESTSSRAQALFATSLGLQRNLVPDQPLSGLNTHAQDIVMNSLVGRRITAVNGPGVPNEVVQSLTIIDPR